MILRFLHRRRLARAQTALDAARQAYLHAVASRDTRRQHAAGAALRGALHAKMREELR